MNKTKIEWADYTWSPVTGCLHGCEYCYAKKIAERFGGNGGASYIRDRHGKYEELAVSTTGEPFPCKFTPTFYEHRLVEPATHKKPANIFVCSMADLFGEWVPDEWIQAVFKACKAAPWHRYLFLTKNPDKLAEMGYKDELPTSSNLWFGTSTPTPETAHLTSCEVNTFTSTEPLHADFKECEIDVNWVIVGAETGNRKGKIIPKREWIDNIVEQCRVANVPVFMKNSLTSIWSESLIQEFPW